MGKKVPVIGRIDASGEAREFPAVRVVGGLGDFIECPDFGEMLDKRDLMALLAHEEGCGGEG